MTSKVIRLLKINLLLFVIAAAIAAYLVYHHYTLINGNGGFGSFCSINTSIDCDTVNTSRYSVVFGVPVATLGFSYYAFAIVLTILGIVNAYIRREAIFLLAPLATASALVSIMMLGIMLFSLKTLCLMCTALHVLDIAGSLLLIWTAKEFAETNGLTKELSQVSPSRTLTLAGVGVAMFVGIFLATSQLEDKAPFDEEDFRSQFRSQPVQNIDPGNSPRQGLSGDNPPIRIIEFADFQCPACGMAARHMHRLLKIYGNKFQLVFKSFPLDPSCNPHVHRSVHENACTAAKAAYCAQHQGKFEEMYEKLFSSQHDITPDSVRAWASAFGLNRVDFDACLTSAETSNALLKDMDLAKSLELDTTPTFFINGKKVEGPIDENRLLALFRELGK